MYRISGRIRYPAGYWLSGHYPVSGSYYPVNLNYFFYLTAHVWSRGNLYVHTFCHAEGISFTRQRSRDCCLARVLLVHYYCSLLFSFWPAALALGEGERHDSRSSHRRCWLWEHICHAFNLVYTFTTVTGGRHYGRRADTAIQRYYAAI